MGRYTHCFDQKNMGDCLELTEPMSLIYYKGSGEFVNENRSESFVASEAMMISGGTGLVPLLDILLQIYKGEQLRKFPVTLLHSEREKEFFFMEKELRDLEQNCRFVYRQFVTGESQARISRGDLEKAIDQKDTSKMAFLICGSRQMS